MKSEGETFEGESLISSEDLKALYGAPLPTDPEHNWLSNSVTDENLSILKSKCAKNEMIIDTLTWEKFEESVGNVPAKIKLNGVEDCLLKDAVLVPSNDFKSKHWIHLAVLPKKKLVVCLHH